MRLFSWPGVTALACAAVGGFMAGKSVHRHDAAVLQVCDGSELCDATPVRLVPPQQVEETDLSCPSTLAESFGPQSMEPPLADMPDAVHTVKFELPAGAPDGPETPAQMPYLVDVGEPALLPPLGDAPLLPPPAVTQTAPEPGNPIYQAVKRFIDDAVKSPEYPSEAQQKMNRLIEQTENERQLGEEWRRIWRNDPPATMVRPQIVSDKVPLGKPPVSEHPSAMTPQKSPPKPSPKQDTPNIRPGDLSPTPNGK